MNYQVEGVILKSWDLGEYDRIYEIFSAEAGKMRIFAKGVRKIKAKLASGLEPLTLSKVYLFKGRGVDRAVGVLILRQYQEIKKELEITKEVNDVVCILRNFIGEQEPSESAYEDFLNYLDACKEGYPLNKIFFLWRLIQGSGYQHNWYNCLCCEKKLTSQGGYFFIPLKGVVCDDCQRNKPFGQSVKISEDCIKVLRFIENKERKVVKKLKLGDKLEGDLMFITKNTIEVVLNRNVYL